MKIGAKVHFFNYEMRRRRAELGWSQKRLAEECGVNIWQVCVIEQLKQPYGNIQGINDKLFKIARALEMNFDALFPEEYLQMILDKRLPRKARGRSYLWVCDISLGQLPENTPELLVPGADEEVFRADKIDAVRRAIAELPDRQAAILAVRFGLDGNPPMTLEETGHIFGTTRERIQQLECKALRNLRHPNVAGPLRVYVR